MASSEDDKRVAAYLSSVKPVNETTKAASISSTHDSSLDETGRVTPSKANVKRNKAEPSLWVPSHEAFLDQTVLLNKHAGAGDTYEFINEQLKDIADDFQNFTRYPEEYKTVGYHLDEEREGCYSLELFASKETDSVGINFSRFEGNGKALSCLWKEIKKRLHDSDFYIDKFIDNLDDDEESEPNEETVEKFKYIDFSKDETLVNKLTRDIEDVKKGATALLLLQHNLNKEENMELVLGNKETCQGLFNATVQRLADEKLTVPGAISASRILKKLLENEADVAVEADQIKGMLNAASKFSAENTTSKMPMVSEEASTHLLSSTVLAKEKVSGDLSEINEIVSEILDKTKFDNVRDAAEELVSTN